MIKFFSTIFLLLSGVLFAQSTPNFELVGFATENGGTTGGAGGTTVTAKTYSELKSYAESSNKYIIMVEGTITNGTGGGIISVKSNKSIIGVGSSAFLSGVGIEIKNNNNIILQNFKQTLVGVTTPKSLNDGDCISISGSSKNIWIDHCELYSEDPDVQTNIDKYDGLIDIKNQSGFITISWNYLHDHHKGGLVGSSDTDLYVDRKVTIHHNYYNKVRLRVPMYRGSIGHFYNNYVVGATDASEIRAGTCVRVEKNYYEKLHYSIYTPADSKGSTERIDNIEVSRTSRAYPANCTADIKYSYQQALTAITNDVKTVVPMYSGVGKLNGVDIKPREAATYIYNYDNSGNLSWENSNSWTPSLVPSKIDTAIIKSGEVQIKSDIDALVKVEDNGVLRMIGYFTVPNITLNGGVLQVNSSNATYGLKSTVKVDKASSIIAGSNAVTVFNSAITFTGTADLNKTAAGTLILNSSSPYYSGNWNIKEGVLKAKSSHALGMGKIVVESAASLTSEVNGALAGCEYLEMKQGATVTINASIDTVTYLTINSEYIPVGVYSSSDYPDYMKGSGKLVVLKSENSTSALDVDTKDCNQLEVVPNPATVDAIIRFSSEKIDNLKLVVYNETGAEKARVDLKEGSSGVVKWSDLYIEESGVYTAILLHGSKEVKRVKFYY